MPKKMTDPSSSDLPTLQLNVTSTTASQFIYNGPITDFSIALGTSIAKKRHLPK
jgi:hypothetical protein